MAELHDKPSSRARLAGFGCFVAFETLAFLLLRWLTSGLGESNQMQPENTIVRNWVMVATFLLLYLTLTIATQQVLSNRLPRRYRSQVLGWFYVSLGLGFVLLFFL